MRVRKEEGREGGREGWREGGREGGKVKRGGLCYENLNFLSLTSSVECTSKLLNKPNIFGSGG